jgi:SAM-dependent methyltransferase
MNHDTDPRRDVPTPTPTQRRAPLSAPTSVSVSPHAGGPPDAETQRVHERYARRAAADARYSLLDPAAMMALQERQRATLALLREIGLTDLPALRLLEVGSGAGGNLIDWLRLGLAPEHLCGIELLPERHLQARHQLPAALHLVCADACEALPSLGQHDIVFQATVFSSLLDHAFQQRLADAMWAAVRPGGGVLWYDFTVNNPRNADVRGVPLPRVRALFPHGTMRARRITLAPPIARRVASLHPKLYSVFNALPLLRTHTLVWIAKP